MANLVEMGVTGIITTEIMEIGKEVIWSVFVAEKKDIKGMIVHYGSNVRTRE
jgi:hypothetical protein